MSQLTIELPPDLEKSLHARAAEGGFGSPQEYVRALIEADSGQLPDDGQASKLCDYGAPPELCYHNDAELEAMLLEAINSGPGEPFLQVEWDELRADLKRNFGAPDAHV